MILYKLIIVLTILGAFMQITSKLTKPITEVKYLNVENTDRYRIIIRFFFEEYEKLKYWIYQDDIYQAILTYGVFESYTYDHCIGDLKALSDWGNLIPSQDTRKVSTLEEFRNKKYRYQLSEYTVEIERMVLRLENLTYEGASLEPTLVERIGQYINQIESMSQTSNDQIDVLITWWNDLNSDFIRLNQNYQDYMRELNSLKAEEMMNTREFLLYKEQLVNYLRSFVKSLQLHVDRIEDKMKKISDEILEHVFQKIFEHEKSIPRFAYEVDEQAILSNIRGRYLNIRSWFVSDGNNSAECMKVYDMTNDVIRKITRYAQRISERSSSGANRRDEYKKLAQLFGQCNTIRDAHMLSACVFGVSRTFHIQADLIRETDSINSGVYEEKPHIVSIRPRVRQFREKSKPSSIEDRSELKERIRLKAFEKMERDTKLAHQYIVNHRLVFRDLPVITPEERSLMLNWLSKGLEHSDRQGKTEQGLRYTIVLEEERNCIVKCTDGIFEMPDFVLAFEEER